MYMWVSICGLELCGIACKGSGVSAYVGIALCGRSSIIQKRMKPFGAYRIGWKERAGAHSEPGRGTSYSTSRRVLKRRAQGFGGDAIPDGRPLVAFTAVRHGRALCDSLEFDTSMSRVVPL